MMTPAAKFAEGMERTGTREHRIIPFTEDVHVLTLPPTRSGHARIQRDGIVVNRLVYWADIMKDPEVGGQDVDVKFDPLDVSIAYARIKGRWHKCISQYATVFQGRTKKEIELASQIIRRRAKAAGAALSISAKRLAEFLASAEAEETLHRRRLQDMAVKRTLDLQLAESNGSDALDQSLLAKSENGHALVEDIVAAAPAATELYPDC